VPEPETPTSVATSWNVYATNLKIHEDGHAAIDRDHANRLTVALQNLQALDCKNLGAQTQATISSYITMLNTANVLYDSQTNHGANQGAVL
jgi:predicted secreted Zn-dependent protease